jgi:mRNA-degrading endonuclease toxin of MazEF toxin-antitoxin module
MNPKHGEVWLVDMGMAAKTRPTVVLSSDTQLVEPLLTTEVPGREGPERIGDGGRHHAEDPRCGAEG